ncbi:hypothetical protein WOLCODRAFT_158057 [Wolfiporia cocos MD-104 SS10]|uniref:Uncharacterized protein n=1 Tax=Wolfiporia cocos (strain MD-104) TaxID=742152 RepID=A0A2H3J507_WOLCO|nr:hypothetical protein WOLCODRAFT_158057 [Wolfiporia cocos MD-104 SS10]
MEQDASNSEEDEENKEDQMGREEEEKSGRAETDGSVAAAFQRLQHNDDMEMDGEGEVPRQLTRVAEHERRETSQAPQASVHVQAEQPSADNEGRYSRYHSQVGDDQDDLLKAVTQMSGMLHQLVHKVDVLQETVHEMQVGQVGLQTQLEALRQVALGVPLATSTTTAPAPLATSVTAVPLLPTRLTTPPPMPLTMPPPVHLMTPPDAPHVPDMTLATSTTMAPAPLATSVTAVPLLPARLVTLPPAHLVTLPPMHSAMPPDAPDVPDVALATTATMALTRESVRTA